MYDLIIVGAGSLGRYAYLIAEMAPNLASYRFKGFLSDDPHILDSYKIDAPILSDIESYQPQPNDRFICAIAALPVRVSIIRGLEAKGAKFTNIIHPQAFVSDNAEIGTGCLIARYACVEQDAQVGNHVIVNVYASCAHDSRIGDYSVFSPYAIATGNSVLEEGVFLGTHVTVAPSCSVGAYSKVSANSSVLKSVPPHSLVYGVPGQIVSSASRAQPDKVR